MANETHDSLCTVAIRFATDNTVLLLDSIQLTLSPFAMLITALTATILVRRRIFHANVRVIFVAFLAALCLHASGIAVTSSVNIALAVQQRTNAGTDDVDDCEHLLVEEDTCTVLLLPQQIGWTVVNLVVLLLVLERVWATVAYKTYEQAESKCFAFSVVLFMWGIIPVSMILFDLLLMGEDDQMVRCSRYAMLHERSHSDSHSQHELAFDELAGGVFIELLLFVVFLLTTYVNRRREVLSRPARNAASMRAAQQHQLSHRYQLRDNIRLSAMVTRALVAHCLLITLTGGATLALVMAELPLHDADRVYSVYTLTFHVYVVYVMSLCARHSKQFATVVKKVTPVMLHRLLIGPPSNVVVPTPAVINPANHMQILEAMWQRTAQN